MLVDIWELNAGHAPRDREDVRSSVPYRGFIRVDRLWTDRDLDRAPVHVDVQPLSLETLYSARMRYWRGLNLVLEGWQRQAIPGRSGVNQRFPQRWWVRLVLDPQVPAMSVYDLRQLANARRSDAAQRLPTSNLNEAHR